MNIDEQRKQWLRERQQSIQASDVAKILGEHPTYGGIDVYLEKTGEIKDNEYQIYLAYGHDVEEAVAKAYKHHTGRDYENPGDFCIHKHPDIPWLGATLDRVTWDKSRAGALECKSEGGLRRRNGYICTADEWQEEPHIWQQIQLQTQMACAQMSWGSLASMWPGYDLRYKDFEYDLEFLDAIYPLLDEFWWHVQRREPPPLTYQPHKKLEAIKRLWDRDNGETIPLTHEQMVLIDEWEILKAEVKKQDNKRKDLEAQIYEMLGAATFGALPDGTILIAKTINKRGYTVDVKPTSYRTVRRKRV